MPPLTVFPIEGVPEVRAGDVLAELLVAAAQEQGTPFEPDDCVVVTQKVVSKAEGRVVPLDASDPGARRALIESESVRVLRRRDELIISETRHGFVCANAGIDLSNIPDGQAALLPVDPDRSAQRIRDGIRAHAGVDVGVIVSDTFGRAWRVGLTDVAIGVAGRAPPGGPRGPARPPPPPGPAAPAAPPPASARPPPPPHGQKPAGAAGGGPGPPRP